MRRDDAGFAEGPDYGQARWATDAEVRPHLDKEGGLAGYYQGRMFTYGGLPGSAGWLHVGGAGSQKTTSLVIPNLCGLNWRNPRNLFVLDFKGELAKTTLRSQKKQRRKAYVINPGGMFDLPQDRVDPFEILASSPTPHADAAMLVDWLNPSASAGASRDPFFETAAKRRQHSPLMFLAGDMKQASMPRFYALMRRLNGPEKEFEDTTRTLLSSENLEIARETQDLINQRRHGERTHVAIMETVFNNLRFLSDPLLQRALAEPTFSLSELSCSDEPVIIYLCIPPNLIDTWKPYVRAIIGAAMLYAQRSIGKPRRRRPMFILDEAAQLGRFEPMLPAYSFGRSAFDILTAWQSLGQIKRLYGDEGLVELLSSSELKTVEGGGIHDNETADYFSRYLGEGTRAYIDPRRRDAHEHASWSALWKIMSGGENPIDAMAEMLHNRAQSGVPHDHHGRRLKTPSELLQLPKYKRLALRGGLAPTLLDKVSCWDDPRLRGHLDPNPYYG